MKNLKRDSIDFGTTKVTVLFRSIFFPTLLGMVFNSLLTVVDGIFVGKGVGSDALAANNIVAPLFMVATGIGLMFGIGASVVASIHLAKGNVHAANINITQALGVSVLMMTVIVVFGYLFPERLVLLLGCSDLLLPFAMPYLKALLPGCVFLLIQSIGMFIIRLDGSPKYASVCNIIPGILNILLDYIFVFPMKMGIMGSSLATSICCGIGAAMVFVYLFFFSRTIRLYRVKLSKTSLYLTIRNVGYMVKNGFSAMIGELSLSMMMILGNYVFIRMLGEDGVAAFSVACYLYPIIFMINNAVAQSAQPIVSFNFGAGNVKRVEQTRKMSLGVAAICGTFATLFLALCVKPLVGLFLTSGTPPYEIAVSGIPVFALSGLFFALNIAFIGYYQSIESNLKATFYSLLRGLVFLVPSFFILPKLCGNTGLWLAVPVTECLTLCVILVLLNKRFPFLRMENHKKHGNN